MTEEFKTRLDIFIATTILFSFILVSAMLADLSQESGTGSHIIAEFIVQSLSYIFPFSFIAELIYVPHPILAYFLLIINFLLYPFIAIVIRKKIIARFKSYKPFLTTYYSIIFIMLIALLCFAYQMTIGR